MMASSELQAELDLIVESGASARLALTMLAEGDDSRELGESMRACAEIETATASQGWRIAWTQKAEEGIGRSLHSLMNVSEAEATDAYWISAARFSERTALSPLYSDQIPVDQVNIGWLLASGPADQAMDALLVIFGEAIVDLSEKANS